jgi:hypothetical protein
LVFSIQPQIDIIIAIEIAIEIAIVIVIAIEIEKVIFAINLPFPKI